VKDEAIYRCIHAACARALPRRVNFCPYCGTGQHAGLDKPAHRPVSVGVPPAPSVLAGAGRVDIAKPGTAPGGTAASPAAPAHAAAPHSSAAAGHASAHAPVAPATPAAAHPSSLPAHPAPGSAAAAGGSGAGGRSGPGAATPRPGAGPVNARPPERAPVRLRWWLLALAALWAIWLVAKPTDKKIEARIDKAVALAIECKAREAQSELIALQSTKATPQQLARLQQELNDAAAECTRARQRSKAWRDASAVVETALAASSFDKARARLSAFTRRWGEDEETRALKAKVDAAAPREHPLAPPTGR
jgi:hypothetical protein